MNSESTPADAAPDSQAPEATTTSAVPSAGLQHEDPAYQVFIDTLGYLEPGEVELVREAYRFSAEAHGKQKRLSGEPYVTHPLAVAGALADWRLDANAIIAALLHDVMEDTAVTKAELATRFGKPVAEMVDGLSKLERIEFQSYQDAQAENFRKMLMAMAHDLRVVLIKLADRLHNLQTMQAVSAEKRRRIAHETLEIYAPIANRLGLNNICRQLQDLSFVLIHPLRAEVLGKARKAVRGNRRELLTKILDGVREKLAGSGIDAGVFGREKSLYSIYRKMLEKRLSFSQVLDIYGFRVVVKDTPTCYMALGALHSLYKPVPGKFKDYIAIPKGNGYQSLHTTLIGPYGTPVEIQIRTESMNRLAEDGIASHWLYKDSDDTGADLQAKTDKWLQSLIELQSTAKDSSEFLEHVKVDLFPDEVYVFTPKGKIMVLPRGATVIDFAYAVHTDVGHRCVAARINQELMPLSAQLSNGDQIEIVSAPHANPNPAWLTYAKTSRARSKIRQFIKTMQSDGSGALGENMLNQELRALGVSPGDISASAWSLVVKNSGKKSRKEIYADIGTGRSLAAVIARRLLANDEQPIDNAAAPRSPLVIRGTQGMAVELGGCCHPIPGDPIIGLIRKGQGMVIHTHVCREVRKPGGGEQKHWIDVEWEPELGKQFDVGITITVQNVRGVLASIAGRIAEAGVDIEHLDVDSRNPSLYSDLHVVIQVTDRTHLAKLMRGLRQVPHVVRIVREQR